MANEKRLIDDFKSELMSKFIDLCRGNDYNKLTLLKIGETIDRIYEKYSLLPTVDAVEVVHAYWTGSRFNPMTGEYEESCSHCCAWSSEYGKPYCPNCGSHMMDGGNEDGRSG